jgi:hypothetical protein
MNLVGTGSGSEEQVDWTLGSALEATSTRGSPMSAPGSR